VGTCEVRLRRRSLRVSLSLAGGNNIYSMFEAGFGSGTQPKPCGGTEGQAMSGTYGECDGGLSVEICEQHLAATCNGAYRSVLDSHVGPWAGRQCAGRHLWCVAARQWLRGV
jgi:hypothetical protein